MHMSKKLKLLLHTCCGCCGAFIPEQLSKKLEVDLFYFNPNIHPEKEYLRRLEDVKKAANQANLKVIEHQYDPQEWFAHVRGFELEAEGGKRCSLCFELRLRQTAAYASEYGYDLFASTLTVGRNKKAGVINPIGCRVAKDYGIPFLAHDFKKHGGQDQSICRSDEIGIVRQDYCGCVFSRKASMHGHK